MRGDESTGATSPAKRMTLSCRSCISAAAFVIIASSAAGHDTWILPGTPRVLPGQTVTFDLTSGMAFPKSEVAVKPDRLALANFRLRGKPSELSDRSTERASLRMQARFPQSGIAAVWAESKPRTLELSAKEVREYLEEIGAWETVGKQWRSEGSRRWRETYVKHSKTFVRVGDPEADDSWREPVGMPLELVPERDPTQLESGEELPIRVLRHGKPLSGLPVGVASAGDSKGVLRISDSDGRVTLTLPRSGWWLIRATQLAKSSEADEHWESHFATLTVFAAGPGSLGNRNVSR